jgi:cytochrome c-type biogenesis protein CcmE
MVAVGSFKREDLKSTFDVTDYKNKFSIEYTGILPDLFRKEAYGKAII